MAEVNDLRQLRAHSVSDRVGAVRAARQCKTAMALLAQN
jgi:hypothetical protein